MAKIFIDNQPHEVEDGHNCLEASLSLGLNLPYFCWHPAMGSVGACRQCAVKQYRDENDTKGKLVMACMTAATDGTRISIEDPEAVEFRATVIEWLMENHPHDCPVCDEGSECHLQDMTVMTGHVYRTYRFPKRTHRNQDLGPFVTHEMNRCIQCYRCVRFYNDYADGRDFGVFACHDHVYFGRERDGVLESEFSGNLVEVCPTGVFDDKVFTKRYTRKWDLQTAPSICHLCSLGCNTIPGERYGELRRIRNRFNGEVNGYFLCDRGRYGFQFVNDPERIRHPSGPPATPASAGQVAPASAGQATPASAGQVAPASAGQATPASAGQVAPASAGQATPASAGQVAPASADQATPASAGQVAPASAGQATPASAGQVAPASAGQWTETPQLIAELGRLIGDGSRTIGIGSPRASLEANFALRNLVGPERFFAGLESHQARLVAQILDILRSGPARSPSLQDVRQSDAILVLGEDVTNQAPLLGLALRQAVRNQPLAQADAARVARWDDYAVRELLQRAKGPLFIASVAATRLDDIARQTWHAAPDDLARLGFAVAHAVDAAAPAPDGAGGPENDLAATIAKELLGAKQPLIVAGVGLGNEGIVQAAANIAWALAAAGKPAQLCYTVPEANTLGAGLLSLAERPEAGDLNAAFAAVAQGQADTVIILENDLYERGAADQVDAFLQAAKHVIVLDHTRHATADRATFVLPAATFAEADGTLVNNEGRAQRFYQVLTVNPEVQESWRWLRDLAVAAGRLPQGAWPDLDAVSAALAAELPRFAAILEIAPPATFRIAGEKIARQHARYSGRTAMWANVTIDEPPPPPDPDSPLSFSMEGYHGDPPPALIPRFWWPGWNSIQALNKFQDEVGGPLRGGDPGRRLIEPAAGAKPAYFEKAPPAFKAERGKLLLAPLYHIFGSEPLSMHTPGVAELAPEPYLALGPGDAQRLGLDAGAELDLVLGGQQRHVKVRIVPELPPGVGGLPAGLPGLRGIPLPLTTEFAGV